jgi:hypothetical protein
MAQAAFEGLIECDYAVMAAEIVIEHIYWSAKLVNRFHLREFGAQIAAQRR